MDTSDKSSNQKLYSSISEVADILGVKTSTLRYWEEQISILAPKKNANGVRFYTEKDIQIARSIQNLVKDKGMTLSGADKYIAKEQAKIVVHDEVLQRLEFVKKELTSLLDELNRPH